MENKEKTRTLLVLRILHVVAWIIFVGVCVEAGGFIVNAVATLILTADGARHFWQQVDLTELYNYDSGYFFVVTFFISLVAVLRAILFYLIVKVLYSKKLSLSRPFNTEVRRFIFNITYVTLLIGLFSGWGVKYTEWLVNKGVEMPDIQSLRLGGADVWLFMAVTLFVIAQIFKRGIEIQSENELTV